MDKNNIIEPDQLDVQVRLANYHESQPDMTWMNRLSVDLQLILCVHGQLTIAYKNEPEVIIPPESLLFISPHTEHSLWVSGNSGACLSTFHFECIPGKRWINQDYSLDVTPQLVTPLENQFVHFHRMFKILSDTYTGYNPHRHTQCSHLATSIMLDVLPLWSRSESGPPPKRHQYILDYIREHITEDMSRQHIAEHFHFSPEYINHIFRQELNCTPTEFINRERCLLASQYLEAGLSVKEVAYKVGFNDPAYFSRTFKRHMAFPPKYAKG